MRLPKQAPCVDACTSHHPDLNTPRLQSPDHRPMCLPQLVLIHNAYGDLFSIGSRPIFWVCTGAKLPIRKGLQWIPVFWRKGLLLLPVFLRKGLLLLPVFFYSNHYEFVNLNNSLICFGYKLTVFLPLSLLSPHTMYSRYHLLTLPSPIAPISYRLHLRN